MRRGLLLFTVLFATRTTSAGPSKNAKPLPEVKLEVQRLLDAPPAGSGPPVCAKLDPPYWQLTKYSDTLDREWSTKLGQLKLLRKERACLIACSNQVDCDRAPTCDRLSSSFDAIVAELGSCGTCPYDCGEDVCSKSSLAKAVTNTFIELVKECPQSDPRVHAALEKVTIVAGPKEVVERFARLLAGGDIDAESALKVLQKILTIQDPSLRKRSLEAIATTLGALDVKDVDDRVVLELFDAVGALVARRIAHYELERTTELLRRFSSTEEARRTLALLSLAEDLNVKEKADALNEAIGVLLEKRPDLKAKLPPDYPKRSAPDVLAALVGVLNAAEMSELKSYRDAAEKWPHVPVAWRRLQLKIVTHLRACDGEAQSSPACEAAWTFRNEFMRAVQGHAPQDAYDIAVTQSAREVLDTARRVLDNADACAGLSQDTLKDELCTGPFAGVVTLEVEAAGAHAERLTATAGWVEHILNDRTDGCTLGPDGDCPRTTTDAVPTTGATEGFRLGKVVMTQTGLAKFAKSFADDRHAPEPRCPPWWCGGGRVLTLLGGVGLVVSGVYVSNAHPNTATGDWLWRGGLVVLGVDLGMETWILLRK